LDNAKKHQPALLLFTTTTGNDLGSGVYKTSDKRAIDEDEPRASTQLLVA
jgi:hypothetical protein